MLPKKRPERRRLDHEVPFWVSSEAIFFLTINCQRRGQNQLAYDQVADGLIKAWKFYRDQKLCCPFVVLVMPDHVHLIVSFSVEKSMQRVVRDWKHYTAHTLKVEWQRGFFDHRIRSDEWMSQKWDYIMNNPKAAGLISGDIEWPYYWFNEKSQ